MIGKKTLNPRKNLKIREERGASIEEVITNGELLDVRENPKYTDQVIEIYFYRDYIWAVICGVNPDRYITMYKSRKLKKEFGL